ncbi:MAG: NAD(P)/FAD-dependent oxidoreductase [Cocleimonas sp.]|nr:NAD(P)/FAD-dependent oxidoreductase [Cocleimonas sp.]
MNKHSENNNTDSCDVAIIGAGPTGLSAAITLKEAGLHNIIVIEREAEAGGVPRHCGHPPFGFKEYKKILTGPQYAKKNIERALKLGIKIQCKTTVTKLGENGELSLATPEGLKTLNAKKVLIATGTRETPRSAQFVTGDRALGICNTGALQAMVYLKGKIPFKRPVIVGTEIVSFSALLTCRKAGIKPVAMIEENDKPSVRWPIHYSHYLFASKLLLGNKINKVIGDKRVNAVEVINKNGDISTLECDGILFTGKFTPESSLVQMSHLTIDENFSPTVNALGQCSDPSYYAAGNLIQLSNEEGRNNIFYAKGNAPQAVNVSGLCWEHGRDIANNILKSL